MAEVKVVIKSVDQGSKEVKGFGDALKGAYNEAKLLTAGIVAAGATIKKAFDLSKEGANLNQLTESFDLMNKSVYQTPDLLDRMSEAARGTIKETDLMAGLLKLTAGASDDLASRMAQNAPQLLEIAKASNKLNPALGDTAFLYDSIATGIKRASPLILDNLGIVVKVGEANEKYAQQLGKSVDALTAEEKQIALLNATLEAGGKLIDQVGGNVDSQADAWARLEVMVGESTDRFKQFLADGLLPVVSAMAGDYGKAAEEAADKTLEIAQSENELIKSLSGANEAYELSRTALGRMTGTTDEATAANVDLALKLATVINNADDYTAALREAGTDILKIRRLVEESGQGFILQGVTLEDTAQALIDYANASKEAADADRIFSNYVNQNTPALVDNRTEAEKAADAIAAMGAITDDTQSSYATYTRSIQEAEDAEAALIEREKELAELRAASGDYFTNAIQGNSDLATAIQDGNDQTAALNSLLYEQADAAGAGAETLALLAYATGDYSKEQLNAALQTAAVTAKAAELVDQLTAGTITVGEATSALQEFANDWQAQALVTVEDGSFRALLRKLATFDGGTSRHTARVVTEGSVPSTGSNTGDMGGKGAGKAIGGPVHPGVMYPVGEHNQPELLKTPGGLYLIPGDRGQVINNQQSQGIMGGVTIENLNVTVPASAGGRMQANLIAGAVASELGGLN